MDREQRAACRIRALAGEGAKELAKEYDVTDLTMVRVLANAYVDQDNVERDEDLAGEQVRAMWALRKNVSA